MADEPLAQVADQIEEVAEVTRSLSGREVGFFVAGAGIGVAVGFSVGYFVLSKRMETKYEKIADDEIAQMKEHYHKLAVSLESQVQRRRPLEELVVEKGYAQPGEEARDETRHRFTPEEQAAIDEVNALHPDSGEEAEAVAEEEEVDSSAAGPVPPQAVSNVVNVFTSGAGEEVTPWDYAFETKNRKPDVPYIIHLDEFKENEPEHEQVTYTYYEMDDVLANERDQTVDDMDAFIGLGNLGRWGHGSQDPNVVYVRNEELSIDVEVIRNPGSYEEVITSSIRHSSQRRRTQRGFDDDE